MMPPNQMCIFDYKREKKQVNVDMLIEYYKNEQPEKVNVKDIYKPDNKVNCEYAMTTNTNIPIIIVRFDDGTHSVLDGNHRLYRAAQEGKAEILAHILDEKKLKRYIMN